MQQPDLDGAWGEDPIAWFLDARARAATLESFDVTRAALSTVAANGEPHVRFVLVKWVDASGFTFFTNYESDKARDIEQNPRAALAVHWHTVGLQTRVVGSVQKISAADSDAYFASRPRTSQLGAWASDQSRVIEGRAALDARLRAVEQRFAQQEIIPRPAHWGGLKLVPERIELWQDRAGRLHDRFLFTRNAEAWTRVRLQP